MRPIQHFGHRSSSSVRAQQCSNWPRAYLKYAERTVRSGVLDAAASQSVIEDLRGALHSVGSAKILPFAPCEKGPESLAIGWLRNRCETKRGFVLKIGYARVSSLDQNLDRQIAALRAEGCEKIYREKASGKASMALASSGLLRISLPLAFSP